LNNLFSLFWNNLLPIFLIAGIGFIIGKWLGISPKPISQVVFYILSPALIFDLIMHSVISGADITRIGLIVLLTAVILLLLTYFAGRLLHLERKLLAAVILVVILPNAGNYGLSVASFAFGQETLAYASIYFSFSVIVIFTIGVFVASMGRASVTDSLIALLKVPTVYAVILAFIFLAYNLQVTGPVERAISMLSDATIPMMLILLGLQLQNMAKNIHLRALSLSTIMRLVVSPLIGLVLAFVLRLNGPLFQAVVLESAMPSAVISTVLGTEYDVEPAFVASVVFYTTILSPLTVTPILAFLK
jgi:predicted permease